jgi:formyltetrahydrofolate hydrolase
MMTERELSRSTTWTHAEAAVLAKAVRWHCEGRIVVHGNRTVVLR